MTVTSIGDLARSMMLRIQTSERKAEHDRLTAELASGQTMDIAERVGGDMSIVVDMNSRFSRLDAYDLAIEEANIMAATMQSVLDGMRSDARELGTLLLGMTEASMPQERAQASLQARSSLESAISALNTRIAGRSLFAGAATDQPALADADLLISELKLVLGGLSDWQEVVQAADQWFEDPSGFASAIYRGGESSLTPFRVADGEDLGVAKRADDPAFRALLRDTALAVLATDPDLGLTGAGQSALLKRAGERILTDHGKITEMAAEIGHIQSLLEEFGVRNAAARTGLEQTRNELFAADPYEVATRLKDVQFQLESLYTVTVRSANLSLVNFLK
ncbi:flagellin N-terminal helical domain-containing protein [Jhaorihella thermophila]|uniref:Flagellar hook-associated protein 3 FlgL n=1 Tax=Jhaorihella thermophila TaxID=488547 RepID=A0A1H5XK56_9RHOB|nr:flagellin [Jhaorihella thermophila]SEG11865.1 flagellar hook-associated protein 3 FlgL [Jhaorihella thermophila]